MRTEIADKNSNKGLYIIQYLVAGLIVVSYLSSRSIMILAAMIAFIYMLFVRENEKTVAILLFLLPFSGVFTISDGTTSLFLLLRIACVIKLMFTEKRIPSAFLVTLAVFINYSSISMMLANTSAMMRIANFALWFLVAYSIVIFINESNRGSAARALSQGTILSCVIGLNLGYIPNLGRSILISSYRDAITDEIVSRFSGLWNDPNGLTVFIVASAFACLLALNMDQMKRSEFFLYCILVTVFGILTLSKSCLVLICVFWASVLLSSTELKFKYRMVILIGSAVVLTIIYRNMGNAIDTVIARFTSTTSLSGLTSYRTDIWEMYFNNMSFTTWLVGKGINCALPHGRAAHNTLIQLVYNVGIFGTLLWISLFWQLYAMTGKLREVGKRNYIAIITVLAPMFFLDGMYIEIFYILLPMMFSMSYTKVQTPETLAVQSVKLQREY